MAWVPLQGPSLLQMPLGSSVSWTRGSQWAEQALIPSCSGLQTDFILPVDPLEATSKTGKQSQIQTITAAWDSIPAQNRKGAGEAQNLLSTAQMEAGAPVAPQHLSHGQEHAAPSRKRPLTGKMRLHR